MDLWRQWRGRDEGAPPVFSEKRAEVRDARLRRQFELVAGDNLTTRIQFGDPPDSFDDEPSFRIDREPEPAALVNLLVLPLRLRDLVFLGEIDEEDPLSGQANGGLYAAILYLVIVTAAFVVLLVRYDEVER